MGLTGIQYFRLSQVFFVALLRFWFTLVFNSCYVFQMLCISKNVMYFKQCVELQRSSQTSSLGHLCHFVEVCSLGLDLNKHLYHNSYHIHIFISQFIFMSLCWGTLSTAGSPIMSTCHSIMPSKWTSTSLPAVKRFKIPNFKRILIDCNISEKV